MSGGAFIAPSGAFLRRKRCSTLLRPRQQRPRRSAPCALSPRVDRHTRLSDAVVPIASSARLPGAIHTSSVTRRRTLGSRRARENAAPARRTSARACAIRLPHCCVSRLGGRAPVVCCTSVCAAWQTTFHCVPSLWRYVGVTPLRPRCTSTSAFFHALSACAHVICIIDTRYTLLERRKRAFGKCTWPKSVSEGGWETCF